MATLHYHPNPEEAFAQGRPIRVFCGFLVDESEDVTSDAERVRKHGCKRCPQRRGFPGKINGDSWDKRMLSAARELRVLTENAVGDSVPLTELQDIFKRHSLEIKGKE